MTMTARDASYQRSTENLAWLVAVLNRAADQLERWGSDVDANVLRAHAAQLSRGMQWPGDDFSELDQLVEAVGRVTCRPLPL